MALSEPFPLANTNLRREPTQSGQIHLATPLTGKISLGIEYNGDAGHYTRLEANNASPAKANMFVNGGSSGFSGITNPNDALGGWQMLSLVIKDGYASIYVDGTLDGTSAWYHPGLDTISKIAIGRTADSGADFMFDEATFSVGRSAGGCLPVITTKSQFPLFDFESLVSPISLNDEPYTKIYGRKDVNMQLSKFSYLRILVPSKQWDYPLE